MTHSLHKTHKRPRTQDFSLVELMVVITIILIMMGLLLPVLQAAKLKASEISCLSNERQLGVALCEYAIENTNCVIPAYTQVAGSECSWMDFFYYTRNIEDKNTFVCPGVPGDSYFNPYGGVGLCRKLKRASYIMNTIEEGNWAPMDGTHILSPSSSTGWGNNSGHPIRLQSVRNPSEKIYVTDIYCQVETSINSSAARGILRYIETDQGTFEDRKVGRHHRAGFNAVFGDGHCKHLKDKESTLRNWLVVGKCL